MNKPTLYAALGAMGVALTIAYPAVADNWFKDTLSGCEVFLAENEGTKNVAWSGDCVDGKASGKGVLVVMDGEGLVGIYAGNTEAGHPEGQGRMTLRNKETGGVDSYTGGFAKGTLDGKGELVSSKGWTYTGGFKDGKEHGAGTIETDDGDIFKSDFENGKPVGKALAYYNEEGNVYFGGAEDEKRDGIGHLIKANQDVYIGEFDDGVASGAGIYDTAKGGVLIGQFSGGEPNGFGTYLAPSGDVYQGRFVDGKLTGKTLVTKEDEQQSVEIWENGEKKE